MEVPSKMTIGAQSRTLQLFFIYGRPDGMVTAELFNWSGHVLKTPRTQISDALRRKEAGYTGVYLLFGEKDGKPHAYIGEAENVGDRIRNHDIKKDWWTSAILLISAANKLNKAQVRYLEARLIGLAKSINKVTLDNGTTPPPGGLTEAAEADMETFLDNVLMVLPALGVDSFVKGVRPELSRVGDNEPKSSAPLFELLVKRNNIHATARLINGEFVVQAGSVTAKSWNSQETDTPYARLHADLVKRGILQEQDAHRVFAENYAFTSTRAAASVVNGHPTSGPTAWKIEGQQKSYKDWEAEKLADDSSGK